MTLLTDPFTIALFGAASGAFLAGAAALGASGLGTPARWTALLLLLTAAAHAADWLFWRTTGVRGLFGPIWLGSAMASGFFWAFVQAWFEDRPAPAWRRLGPAFVLGALACAGAILAEAGAPQPWPWFVYSVLVVGFMGHALVMLARGWRGDLVEGRRRLRGPIIVVCVGYIIMVQMGDFVGLFGGTFDVLPWVQALALLLLALAAAAMLFQARGDLLDGMPAPVSSRPASSFEAEKPTGVEPQDRALALRLQQMMVSQEAWRDEGLSMSSLARHLKAPEHRLRQLINAQLGHRNFAAFVNAHRIAAAKAALQDPENGRKPVSAIAFELGFGSLGPFNRAFKEETGLTPTQWRLQALASSELKRADGN
jgi:AraC-like DNA-binding protein